MLERSLKNSMQTAAAVFFMSLPQRWGRGIIGHYWWLECKIKGGEQYIQVMKIVQKYTKNEHTVKIN